MYNTKSKQNQFKSSSSRLNPSVPAKPKQPAITDMNAFPELSSTAAPAINSSDEPMSFANKVKWVVEEEKVEETWYGKLGLSLLVPGDKKVKSFVDETNYPPPALIPAPARPIIGQSSRKPTTSADITVPKSSVSPLLSSPGQSKETISFSSSVDTRLQELHERLRRSRFGGGVQSPAKSTTTVATAAAKKIPKR
jgi:hypothetical protein